MTPSSFDAVHLPDANSNPEETNDQSASPASTAAEFQIEITLTKRRPASWGAKVERLRINEHNLTEAAFAPKTYRVALERGVFRSREDLARAGGGGAYGTDAAQPQMPAWAEQFALRLVFLDQSPYPSREEWKQPEGMPDANKPWEWKEFCGRRLPKA